MLFTKLKANEAFKELENDVNSANDAEKDRIDQIIKSETNRRHNVLVTVRKGDVNGAMRVLKKKLMREGFFQELRRRESFMSKGEKERKAKPLDVEGGNVNKAKQKLEKEDY